MTIIFILVSLDPKVGKVNVSALKNKIVEYVGTRMLQEPLDSMEHCPGVILNDTLSDKDKENLVSLTEPEKVSLVFIELTESEYEAYKESDYTDCVITINRIR